MRTRAREINNLKLPFPSQSNIMEKKKKETGRMSDPQGFFFLSYLQELSLVSQVSESEFYQWAVLDPFERTAGVRTMNPACLYIWATKAITVFTRNRIIKKTSCHRHLKNASPCYSVFSHTAPFIYSTRSWTQRKKKKIRSFTLTSTQKWRTCNVAWTDGWPSTWLVLFPQLLGGTLLTLELLL